MLKSKLFILAGMLVAVMALVLWVAAGNLNRPEANESTQAAAVAAEDSVSVETADVANPAGLDAEQDALAVGKAPDAESDQLTSTDLAAATSHNEAGSSEDGATDAYQRERLLDYGRFPLVPIDANRSVAMAAEALRNGSHPSRVGAWFQPSAFDAAAYAADPQAYVDIPEPGRVFQSAQPTKQTPMIRVVGQRTMEVRQDQEASLQVRVPAGAPVTFTSFAGGMFANKLSTQTVQADSRGLAQVTFLAGPGTIEDVPILAASPLASESILFLARVSLAQPQ